MKARNIYFVQTRKSKRGSKGIEKTKKRFNANIGVRGGYWKK